MSGRVMGVDPGTIRMGYGVLEGDGGRTRVVARGVIGAGKSAALERRINLMYHRIREVMEENRPEIVAVEQPFVGGAKSNPKSIMAVGQAQATVFIAAVDMGVPVFRYTPTQVKKAVTGDGRAGKEEMLRLVAAQLGTGRLETDDEADALAVAICHMAESRAAAAIRNSGG